MPCVLRRYKGHLEKQNKKQPIKTRKTTLTKIHLRQMHEEDRLLAVLIMV